MRRILKEYSLLIIGSVVMASGTALFLLPNKLSTGGFTGIATIFYYYLKIPMGTSILVMNLPLFAIAYLKMGKEFFYKTIFGTFFYSQMLNIIGEIKPFTQDNFLNSVYGGILVGMGLGIVFKARGSTGGSDLLASLIRRFSKTFNTGNLLIIIDIIIISISLIVFKEIEIGLYSSIAILISGKMIDIVFEGINFSKTLFIISDKPEEISNKIMDELAVGATALYGMGLYKNTPKTIIMCACKRRNLILVKNISLEIDPNAFIIITDAREVFGLRI